MTRKKVIFLSLLIIPVIFLFGLFIKVQDPKLWYMCPGCIVRPVHYTYDYSKNDFRILPKVHCAEDPPFLVLLVTNTHDRREAREAIRQTWGKERVIQGHKVVTYFLFGIKTDGNAKDEQDLLRESDLHKDIIQQEFQDTYHNLTIKTLMGLEWITNFCPQATYAMKTDSDMFVNPFYLVELLLKKNQTSNFFTGFLKPNDGPIRYIFSKWYISKDEYPEQKYPPFCSGTGYVFSVDVAKKIYNISSTVPYFKLEDVYVGMCLDRLKIPLQELHSKITFHPDTPQFSVCAYRNLVTSHQIPPQQIVLYWEAMERTEDEKC
ncbi:hypothetical protein GDO81_007027 [Engystomops pustulosus]|uniref:Hexosyltransferase n=1 Tax=Engystomops pustulosus TaxID=76066 RepID=A0AAV7D0V6_ENGPU|nr:hypothetical protein GDO81_007027 [Engystomops pustulosus]